MKNFFSTIAGFGVGAMLVVGCLGLLCIGACIGTVAIIAGGFQEAQNELVDLNDGLGTEDDPIPSNVRIDLDEVEVRLVGVVRPANDRVFAEPAAGSDVVFLDWEITCRVQECNGVSFRARIVDNEGELWREQLVWVVSDSLNVKSALENNTMRGFLPFEIPTDRTIETIRVSWAGSPDLYLDYVGAQ